MSKKQYTQKEKANLLNKVDSLMAQGMSRKNACEELGIAKQTHYSWTKKISRHAVIPAVTIHDGEVKERKVYAKKEKGFNDKCVVIVTNTASLQSVLRQI